MLSQILNLMNFVLGRADRWREKSAEQRALVAAYLHGVSDCLTRIAADLRAGREPHSGCGELAHYARELPKSVQEELAGEATELLLNLRQAANSRAAAMHAKFDAKLAHQNLAVIEETAGNIKGLAVSLAVG
jgi:hypothetical protein